MGVSAELIGYIEADKHDSVVLDEDTVGTRAGAEEVAAENSRGATADESGVDSS